MQTPTAASPDLASLTDRAVALLRGHDRRLLGLTGPPGAGKSTLGQALVSALAARHPGVAALVPMDGWHLRQVHLVERGLTGRKGAPDTFDVEGFVALLGRLRSRDPVLAPELDRTVDDVVDDRVRVDAGVRLVVVEGSYLLLDEPPWDAVRPLLDEVWYLDADEALRRPRLVRRHTDGGRSHREAEAFVSANDEVNAATVAATRGLADLVVRT